LTKRLVVGAAVAAALIGAPTAVAEHRVHVAERQQRVHLVGHSGALRHRRAGLAASPAARRLPGVQWLRQGLLLHPTGPAPFVCAGDTALGGAPVLPYGQLQAGAG
jgi:hypothetical protein